MTDDNRTELEKRADSLALLDANHTFPGLFMFKIIGRQEEQFLERVLSTFRETVEVVDELDYRTRATANGRHLAVTLEVEVRSAEHVLDVYAVVHKIEGVVMVL